MEETFEQLSTFINSSGFDLAVNLIVYFFIALHLAVSIWVARDASIRSGSPIFQIFAVMITVFLPLLGLVVYLLLRPSRPLSEKIIDNFTLLIGMNACAHCGGYVRENYRFCPHCSKKLYQKCKHKTCGKSYSCAFEHCPFCGK